MSREKLQLKMHSIIAILTINAGSNAVPYLSVPNQP